MYNDKEYSAKLLASDKKLEPKTIKGSLKTVSSKFKKNFDTEKR